MAETKELTPTGKIKRPSYETVAHWVKDSWDAVDVNLIRRSFKCCGISNKRDGTEDDWIFNYDRLKQANQLNEEVEVLSDKENEGDEEYENEEENVEEVEYEEEEEEEYEEGEEEEYEEGEEEEYEEKDEEEEDKCDEEDEENECEEGKDENYFGYYEQETNYVNMWD
jgi:hypothetical protein